MNNYDEIFNGVLMGLEQMKDPRVNMDEFYKRLDSFKTFSYKNLNDDEVFWTLTYVMFFNIGKKASMIEKKLPYLKKYLYGFEKLSSLNDSELSSIIINTGFGLQVYRSRENARRFKEIIAEFSSFGQYLSIKFGIHDTNCSEQQIELLYLDLKRRFNGTGIGETSRWHFITEMGFHSLKPDSVIKRVFHRLGLISNEQDNREAIRIGREFSEKLTLPMRYIDIVFVKFGQDGKSDLLGTMDGICLNQNPKCNICPVAYYCNYAKPNQASDRVISKQKRTEPILLKSIPPNHSASQGYFTPDEYVASRYYMNYGSGCQTLIQGVFNLMKSMDMDFRIQKRQNNDFILVATARLNAKRDKNILTVWTYKNGIEIRIMPDKTKPFRMLSDFDDSFIYKLKKIYSKVTHIA